MSRKEQEAAQLKKDWSENPRWKGLKRGYTAEDVVRLRGSVKIEHTLAKLGAEKLWTLCRERPFVNSLGALTGNQAMQQVKAGVPAIYLSGWQVAADANDSLSMYPDQSLYAVTSVPTVVKRINNALQRAERLRVDEEPDRCRRLRGAFRRPVGFGQEMWSHGRQGARADARSGGEIGRRTPG